MANTNHDWWAAIDAATSVGSKIGSTTEEFNLACDHIVQLLKDASTLLEQKSHATATFIAITVIEETAKVHLGMFRREAKTMPRSKDPLYKHSQKHILALGPTVAMGSRLQTAIGDDRIREFMQLARDGGFARLREAALYIENINDNLVSPKSAITKQTARELLLFAIETFDDGLVGYTEYTYSCAEQTDEIFAKWKKHPWAT